MRGDDGVFGRREAGPLDVGAVAEKRENAFVAITRESVKVEGLAVDRSWINLEIAGVDDDAHRRSNRERDAINGAVRHVQINSISYGPSRRGGRATLRLIWWIRAGRASSRRFLHERERELRAVNGHVEVAENVGQRADVVFMRRG